MRTVFSGCPQFMIIGVPLIARMRQKAFRRIPPLLVISTLFSWPTAGCTPPPVRVAGADAVHALFPFLQDGRTTKAEVESRLGLRWQAFSEERIWIYLISVQERQVRAVLPSDKPNQELVLVFDRADRLKRHSLIRLKE